MATNNKNNKNNKKKAPTKVQRKSFGETFAPIIRFFRSETLHFIAGLVFTLFGIFLLISLTSFIFTGQADQSEVESLSSEIIKIKTEIQNWGGTTGAILANILINKWVGFGAYGLALWIIISGLYMMRVVESGYWKASVLCLLGTIIVSLFPIKSKSF